MNLFLVFSFWKGTVSCWLTDVGKVSLPKSYFFEWSCGLGRLLHLVWACGQVSLPWANPSLAPNTSIERKPEIYLAFIIC